MILFDMFSALSQLFSGSVVIASGSWQYQDYLIPLSIVLTQTSCKLAAALGRRAARTVAVVRSATNWKCKRTPASRALLSYLFHHFIVENSTYAFRVAQFSRTKH